LKARQVGLGTGPQLGNASEGCLVEHGTPSSLHPCVRARMAHCHHRVQFAGVFLKLRDSESSFSPRCLEAKLIPASGQVMRASSLGRRSTLRCGPEFPSLRTLLLPFPSPPASADIWTNPAIKAGCRELEVPKQKSCGLANGLVSSIEFSLDTVLCPDPRWIKAALPVPGGTTVPGAGGVLAPSPCSALPCPLLLAPAGVWLPGPTG